MIQEIKISVLDIDRGEDFIQFEVELSNGINSTSFDFYGYNDEFKKFAAGLISFPRTLDDSVIYETGEDNGKWAYYIFLKAYCYDPTGRSAIQIKVYSTAIAPYFHKSDFFIITVPASLNKLGSLIDNWDPLTERQIEWVAENITN